ncbi:MAG: tetratricopeptide repeat protein [Treponema sp.]|nr:tetratricopeptide repeat protein [Treponema sp.]
MMKCRFFLAAVFAFFSAALSYSQSSFKTGEELFSQNRCADAIPYLLKAIDEGANPKAYNYLALSYFKTGDYANAIDACEKGMNTLGTDKKILSYNAGNICFASGNFQDAEKWYSKTLVASPSYSAAYLNRANTRLKLNKMEESLSDYKKYLELEPKDSQKEQIKKLISLLESEKERLAKEEQERAAEEARIREEEERLAAQKALEEEEARKEAERLSALRAEREAEEQKKRALEEEERRKEEEKRLAEEAERRRLLLEDVAASLKQAEAENMLAGSEGTLDYEYETELE